MKKYNIAIVGATGLVGRTMLQVLEERNFPINNLTLLASVRSAGKNVTFKNSNIKIEVLNEKSFNNIDMALFSAGSDISKKFAPIAVKSGCVVIDNSSCWRMDNNVPLVVPEVNPEAAKKHNGIIANPNCSTIQLVVPLFALDRQFKINRLIISTYQAISGAGQKGVDKLHDEMQGKTTADKHKIWNNIMFHSPALENGFTIEEMKIINESRKILSMPSLDIAVTCVRVPVENSHSISVYTELEHQFSLPEIKHCLELQNGIVLVDDIQNEEYPTPQQSNGKDEVFVGRIRRDITHENGLYFWVVADNLRKGAATNAVQIAEFLVENQLLFC